MSGKRFLDRSPKTSRDWLCLVLATVTFYLFVKNLSYFIGGARSFLNILAPFAGGLVIAYILDPLVSFLYAKLLRGRRKWRWVAILLAYVAAVVLLVLLAWLVVPQIVESIVLLIANIPQYVKTVQDFLLQIETRYDLDLSREIQWLDDSESMLAGLTDMASASMPQIVASAREAASNFVAVFTAIASSIYMLAGKDHLLHQLRTVTHAVLPPRAAENTLRICHYLNENFTGFFIGKLIEAAIVGVLTFVCMSVLRLDFAVLISVFIGIMNIIPVFGPFIGAIPSILILLLVDPFQALVFTVMTVIIQQVDGNFIGPKVLGKSIGVSALWVLFSIVVGGELFGIVGLVIGVPLFATLYGLAQEVVAHLLARRGIDAEGNRSEN